MSQSFKLKKLKIGHVNICHLKNKVTDLCAYVSHKQPFHLFGVTETHINSEISDESIRIPNFSFCRRDAEKPGHTGIVAYIHDSIRHLVRRRDDLENSNVECIWLEVKGPKSRPLLVSFMYRHPDSLFSWYDDFWETVDSADIHKKAVLLLGDFNIDLFKSHTSWECTTTAVGLEQLVENPTRVATKLDTTTSTLIDHIYSNCPLQVSGVGVGNLSASDHFPVFCSWLCKQPLEAKHCHTTVTYRSFKRFNEANFLNDLRNTPFDLVYQETDPDSALLLWYNLFNPVLDKHAPLRQRRVKKEKPPWLNKELIDAMEIRDRLKKNKRSDEYKKHRTRVKNLVVKAKKAVYKKMISKGEDTSSLWRAVNMVTRGNTKKRSNTANTIPPDLTPEIFNDHFLSTVESLLSSTSQSHEYRCPTKLSDFCHTRTDESDPFVIPPMDIHVVGKMITSLANKKSCGIDEISPKIIKISLPFILDSLTYIYNLAIKCNTFPTLFKSSKVIPLPKSKDVTDVNNYRPISLLSVLSKPLERHVQKHLTNYLESRSLLHSFQSGFRSKHSCQTALTRLVDTWLKSVHEFKITGSLFLDLRKAFDLVNHDILLKKLDLYFCNTDSVSFIKSYLSDRTQSVLLNGRYSSEGAVQHGVPQGSILGPLLFSLYINDLPLHFSSDLVSCDLFADDATVHTPDQDIKDVNDRLQKSLEEVSDWCNNNRMVLHPSKTESMVITTRQKHQDADPLLLDLSLNGNTIKQVEQHKLLGVVVDEKLEWKDHTKKICKKISSNLFMLSKLRPLTNTETRKMFYDAHIRSHIDYVSTVWDGCSGAGLKRLNSLQRRAAKLVHPGKDISADQKLQELGILPLTSHLKFNKAILMYKVIHKPCPEYMRNKFTILSDTDSRRGLEFKYPPARIDFCKQSFAFSGAVLWNSLPKRVKEAGALSIFKNSLFNHLAPD